MKTPTISWEPSRVHTPSRPWCATFQRIIGDEAREQILLATGDLPDVVIASVGGGSNAMGIFTAFLDDPRSAFWAWRPPAWGSRPAVTARPSMPAAHGVLHGAFSVTLQDDEGQIGESHSISAGLDYPGVGPEHAWLQESGRATYTTCTDTQALSAFATLARAEGIIPALESSHALSVALEEAARPNGPRSILVNLSGRGDKDLETVIAALPGGGAA
jgi:tryptophan synthase beta chain